MPPKRIWTIEAWIPWDPWRCPTVSGSRSFTSCKLRRLEAKSTPLTLFHVLQTIQEQCGKVHYPAEIGHFPRGILLLWWLVLSSTAMFRKVLHVKVISTWIQTQGFSADHCPEHHTVSADLLSSRSAGVGNSVPWMSASNRFSILLDELLSAWDYMWLIGDQVG